MSSTSSNSASPTSEIPLTTTFAPALSCFTDITWNSPYGYPNSWSVAAGPLSNCWPCWLGLPSSSCMPSQWSPKAIYSPGVCPFGYSVACSSVNRIGSLSETVGTCCPSNYQCLTDTTAWPWMSTQPCISAVTDTQLSFRAISVINGVTTTARYPVSTLFGLETPAVYAYSVQIRWQNSNTKTSTESTTSAQSTSPNLPLSTTSLSHSSSGLSTGAKAGIGVAVAVIVLILLGAIFFFLIRQRRARQESRNQQVTPSPNRGPAVQLVHDTNQHVEYGKSELDTSTERQRFKNPHQSYHSMPEIAELPVTSRSR